MRKVLLGLLMLTALVAFGITEAKAAGSDGVAVTVTITQLLSVSVSPDAWPIGSVTEDSTLSTVGTAYTLTATNDGNVTENLTTNVGDSTDWVAAIAAGADAFVMNQSTDGGTNWTNIDPTAGVSLAAALVSGGTQDFDLQFLAPSSTTVGGVQQSIAITVTASLP